MKRLLVTSLLVPAVALAGGGHYRHLDDAADALEDALAEVQRGSKTCREGLSDNLRQVLADVEAAQDGVTVKRIEDIRLFLGGVALAGLLGGCPARAGEAVDRASAALTRAKDILVARAGEDARERDRYDEPYRYRSRERDRNRDRDRYDDRDRERDRAPRGEIHFGKFSVVLKSKVRNVPGMNGQPAIELQQGEIRANGLDGRRVYFTSQFQTARGRPGPEPITTAPVRVRGARDVPLKSGVFYFRHETLRRHDLDDEGEFVVEIAAYDAQTREELGHTEVHFALDLGGKDRDRDRERSVDRDCGIRGDTGCSMSLGGRYPMDGETFQGLLTAVRANRSELSKLESIKSVLRNQLLTARQLGALLDEFGSELNMLELAEQARPRLVNPNHALSLAAKFKSSLNQEEFTKLMAQADER